MAKKTEISRAARVLFAQFGLKKVTTDDIAKRARVSKATVYKYYKNKYHIFDEIVTDEIEGAIGAIDDAVEGKVLLVDKLRAYLNTKMDRVNTFANIYKITQETTPESQDYLEQIQIRFMQEEREIIRKILEAGIMNSELEVDNMDLTSHAIQMVLRFVEDASALPGMNIDKTLLRDQMLEIIINGVRRREDKWHSGRNMDERIQARSPVGHG
jgi:AcrR family transcriptional regulator